MSMHDRIIEAFGQEFIHELALKHGIAWPVVPQDNDQHGWVERDGDAEHESEYDVADIPADDLDAGFRLIRILWDRYAERPEMLNRLTIRFGQAEVDARYGPTWTHGMYVDLD